ncbi:hypothetical protein H9X96_00550 [Pedobacter sp. N36a]|uniref:hypothetical protein n=1 Tax=Pedobacter sp. N36a TaxID=2767996 RepID=UPI001656EDCF|nr:hypothetical protein [Pedobacter sp. N36a]MBC8984258.1 hypothetical protein [Pedobacter sp. N36a]
MLKLLLKTLIKAFYAGHAGLFLFGFYLAFGVVEASQLLSYHKTLMLMVYASPMILAFVCCFWALYLLKCLFFIRKQMQLEQYHFLWLLAATAKKRQFILWFQVYTVLLLPILVYVLPLIYVGLAEKAFTAVFAIISVIVLLLTMVSGYMFRIINYSHVPVKVYFVFPCPQLKKPYWTWPLYHLLTEQTLMLFLSKILSFTMFTVVVWMFNDVSKDLRVALIGILAAVLAHSMVIQVMLRQETDQLSFDRSLPIRLGTRMGHTLLVFLVLFIPEILFYLQRSAWQFWPFMVAMGFGVAGLMTLRMVLYWIKLDLDLYFKWLLAFFFVSMFVILAGYAVPYSVLLLTCYCLYFFFFYYRTDLKEM